MKEVKKLAGRCWKRTFQEEGIASAKTESKMDGQQWRMVSVGVEKVQPSRASQPTAQL